MIQDIEKTIRNYLPEVLHMSLATCRNQKSRVCEVHFVYDDLLNLYFRSKSDRRHSLEILDNPYVSGNIVKQHNIDDDVRGIYFEGFAEIISVDVGGIYDLFVNRLDKDMSILSNQYEQDGHKFYKVTVSDY